MIDLDKYVEFTRTTAIYPRGDQMAEAMYLALGLAGEAGEVAGKIKKHFRDGKLDRDALADELGDVFWYFARICDTFGFVPEGIILNNQEKLEGRKERGTIGGSGDSR